MTTTEPFVTSALIAIYRPSVKDLSHSKAQFTKFDIKPSRGAYMIVDRRTSNPRLRPIPDTDRFELFYWSNVKGGIGRLAIDVLRGTGDLVSHAFALGLDVTCCTANPFFDLARGPSTAQEHAISSSLWKNSCFVIVLVM